MRQMYWCIFWKSKLIFNYASRSVCQLTGSYRKKTAWLVLSPIFVAIAPEPRPWFFALKKRAFLLFSTRYAA